MMDKLLYSSYLLRIWRVVRDDELVWMASLVDPRTGARLSFASLEDLYAFLLKDVRQLDIQSQRLTGKPVSLQADRRKMNHTNGATQPKEKSHEED